MLKKSGLKILSVLLWSFASSKILGKGIPALIADHRWWIVVLALIIAGGFIAMFNKVSSKYAARIDGLEGERFPFYRFMSPKGYVLIAFMMTLGITMGKIPGMPPAFFGSFYIGLGSGLAFGAIKFLLSALGVSRL